MDYVEFKLLYDALKAMPLHFASTHRANHLPQKTYCDARSKGLQAQNITPL